MYYVLGVEVAARAENDLHLNYAEPFLVIFQLHRGSSLTNRVFGVSES